MSIPRICCWRQRPRALNSASWMMTVRREPTRRSWRHRSTLLRRTAGSNWSKIARWRPRSRRFESWWWTCAPDRPARSMSLSVVRDRIGVIVMALKSPRFSTNERLRRAAENKPALNKNETGEAVRILQQALIDLGFPLPISVRKFGSPDGVFGNETVTKVREFQTKYRLKPDGSVGMKTMAKLDELLPTAKPLPPLPPSGFTHKVRLHLRSIAMPAQA